MELAQHEKALTALRVQELATDLGEQYAGHMKVVAGDMAAGQALGILALRLQVPGHFAPPAYEMPSVIGPAWATAAGWCCPWTGPPRGDGGHRRAVARRWLRWGLMVARSRADAGHHAPHGHGRREESIDPTPLRRSRATLRTLDDVAAELARLYRRAERGQIHTADAYRLTYMLTSLAKVLEAARQAPLPDAEAMTTNAMQPFGLADLYQVMHALRMDRLEEVTDAAQP